MSSIKRAPMQLGVEGGDTKKARAFAQAFYSMMYQRLPRALWQRDIPGHDGGGRFSHVLMQGFSAIVSIAEEVDGEVWVHLSIATQPGTPMPSWEMLKNAKEQFLGDIEAYQVFPPKAKWVNQHPNCLHLWALLEGKPPLPDFTRGGNSI